VLSQCKVCGKAESELDQPCAAPPAQTPPKDDFISKRAQFEAEWSKVREMQRQCREFIEKQKTPPPRLTAADFDKLHEEYLRGHGDGAWFADVVQNAVRKQWAKQFGVNDE
jgi:hypothetical protein